MPRLWLIRHAEPTVAVGSDPDLTDTGRAQAAALVGRVAPCALRTSPMLRARATARPLAEAWGVEAVVDPAFRELPSPTRTDRERQEWLRLAMQATYDKLGTDVMSWRAAIVDAVASVRDDTAVVTHALVINAAVGACTGDRRVLHMRPAHTSITVLDVDGGALSLVARGDDVDTIVT